MSYYSFKDEETGKEHGSFEVFFQTEAECTIFTKHWREEGNRDPEEEFPYTEGWYWWSCFPGCIPDSDAYGPFATEEEAVKGANE